MRSGLLALLIFVSLPLLAALGHDAWLFYENQDKGFLFSEIGFLWTRYNPESFLSAREVMSPEDWAKLSTYILDQKTVVLTGAFTVFCYAIIALAKIFGSGAGQGISFNAKNKKVDVVLGEAKQKKYQYKRR